MGSARLDDGHAPTLAAVTPDLSREAIITDAEPNRYRPAKPLRLALPALVLASTALWIAGAFWLARGAIAAMTGPALIEFIAAVAVIPVLGGVAWLTTGRASRTEARRFADTSQAMRAEAVMLERVTAALAATLDVERAKLADQARAFARLGEDATERLAGLGGGFAAEMAIADRHSSALADAAQDAQARLGVLVALLPRARAETAETAELLEQVSASTMRAATALDAKVTALAGQAREAGTLADVAASRLAGHIAHMEKASDRTGARLDAVTGEMTAAVDALLDRTAQALDESRRGLAAQGEAMLAIVTAHQATLDGAARESADALARRIDTIEQVIDRIADRLEVLRTASDGMVAALDAGISHVGARLDGLQAHGVERSRLLTASIDALGTAAAAMTETLRVGSDVAQQAIGTADRLLVALDAGAREIDETLPSALGRLDARVEASRAIVARAQPDLLALVSAAESTHDAVGGLAQVIAGQRDEVDRLSRVLLDTLAAGRGEADALGASIEGATTQAHRLADDAAPRLLDSLLRVRDTAAVAADRAREAIAAVIPEAADRLEAASGAALARAAAGGVERQVAAMADASDAAVAAATRAAERLAERLRELSDATASLDTRFERARVERDELDRDTFAGRVSALLERLNAASIDLAKSLSPEVSDAAWTAYLKGDRGVFTRRAVRLLDGGQARDVARLYHGDSDFREQVNRYVHDFEAMLRTVLAQREGAPLSVTLLSSDMGRLYVALAQAIERLR